MMLNHSVRGGQNASSMEAEIAAPAPTMYYQIRTQFAESVAYPDKGRQGHHQGGQRLFAPYREDCELTRPDSIRSLRDGSPVRAAKRNPAAIVAKVSAAAST